MPRVRPLPVEEMEPEIREFVAQATSESYAARAEMGAGADVFMPVLANAPANVLQYFRDFYPRFMLETRGRIDARLFELARLKAGSIDCRDF